MTKSQGRMKWFLLFAFVASAAENVTQFRAIAVRDEAIRAETEALVVMAEGLDANGSIANHNRDIAKALNAQLATCRGFKDL